jgi:hypothetical protein
LESKASALGVFLESKALALGVFLESKALALGVFFGVQSFSFRRVLSLAVGEDHHGISPLRLR